MDEEQFYAEGDNAVAFLLPGVEYPSPGEVGEAALNLISLSSPVDDVDAGPLLAGLDGWGVRVAVLDTGVFAEHPALANRLDFDASINLTTDDPADWTDRNGHGTHCAGTIAAEDVGAIMSGMAPGATIVAVKVLGDDGGGNMATVTAGIRHAISVGVDIISMSLGNGADETAGEVFHDDGADQYAAVQEALLAGITVVSSAGNNGGRSDLNEINAPASFGGVITVASHDDDYVRSSFSNMGGELDFIAPGETVSTYPRGVPYGPDGRPGNDYEGLAGTSMSCPLVAGIAALLIQAGRERPDTMSADFAARVDAHDFRARNAYEVREMLRYLSDRPNEHSREDGYGSFSGVCGFTKLHLDCAALCLADA